MFGMNDDDDDDDDLEAELHQILGTGAKPKAGKAKPQGKQCKQYTFDGIGRPNSLHSACSVQQA